MKRLLTCRNAILRYTTLIRFLIFVVVFYASLPVWISSAQKNLPYQDTVSEILAPLQYSGLSSLLDKDSNVSVDFEKKIWILHQELNFDDEGVEILDEGNSGLCGRLSRYVYQKIKNVFPSDRYKILFEKVREKDYFFAPQASHFVVTIKDLVNEEKYVIDPSFKRYGAVGDFDVYHYIEEQDPQAYINANKSSERFFFIDSASPIMIRDDALLVFSVESVDGQIDKNHFILSISAVKKQASRGEYVLGLKYIDGYLQTYINEELLHRLLTEDEVTHLQQKMFQWSVAISGN
ncbi:MAG: hypothetical protein JNN05_07380 [Candidatus Omnitrophica bacterium]|nr:hypothetical protein [Candidatus Omnitrophota bacterium]